MAGYNRIIMMGNLTRDPDHKQLASGQSVCRLSIASNRQFKNRQTGDMIQEVCYIDVDVWGPQANSCNQYLQKGRSVLVEGRIKFDTWQDTNGQTRSKHSITADRVVFLANSASDTVSDTMSNSRVETPKSTVSNELEKDLMDQINKIKAKVEPAKPAAKPRKNAEKKEEVPNVGGVDFKDTPPFQDDLPF